MNLNYLFENWRRVLDLAWDHVTLTVIALALALLLAIPLGVVVAHWPRTSLPIIGVLGIVYTIPSLALLAFLIPVFGLGRQPAIFVLASYAQLSLVRNISAALRGVDPSVLESARGSGMSDSQVFRNVRLPLAMPVLIAGLRVASVTTISLATLTAWIAAGGLGTLLFDGISRDNPSMILAGAIAIAVLAAVTDLSLRFSERLTSVSRSQRRV